MKQSIFKPVLLQTNLFQETLERRKNVADQCTKFRGGKKSHLYVEIMLKVCKNLAVQQDYSD